MKASGYTFAQLKSLGLAGAVDAVIEANPGESFRAKEKARQLARVGFLGDVMHIWSTYASGAPCDAADVDQAISDHIAALDLAKQALVELATHRVENPGTIKHADTEHAIRVFA